MDNLTTDTPEIPTVTIPLTKGYSTVIDTVDSDLADLKWHTKVDKHTCYAKRDTPRPHQRSLFIHQVIISRMIGRDLVKGEKVDHIDGDGLNNRRSNLRLATHAENLQNQRTRRDNTSGFKGVSWDRRSLKWRAGIELNGKTKHLGLFTTPEAAYEAYCKAASELHGEFARLE